MMEILNKSLLQGEKAKRRRSRAKSNSSTAKEEASKQGLLLNHLFWGVV